TEPERVSIAVHETPDVDAEIIKGLRDSAKKMLGVPGRPHQRQDFREKGQTFSWTLGAGQAEAAIEWLAAAAALPSNWLGGAGKVAIDYRFRLKSARGAELPFQRKEDYLGQIYNGYGILLGESGCRLTVSARCALSLVLFLPFEEPGAALWEYASFVQE